MARPAGVRNQDYEDKRQALLASMLAYVELEDVVQPSLRQLAISAGVSDVSLRHYFGDRRGVITALYEYLRENSKGIRAMMRQKADTVTDAISAYIAMIGHAGADARYINRHVFALREAIADMEAYKSYEKDVLNPAADALGEGLVKSSGGLMDMDAARQAASHIVFNTMFLAMQRAMADGPYDTDLFSAQLQRFSNWVSTGLEADMMSRAA